MWFAFLYNKDGCNKTRYEFVGEWDEFVGEWYEFVGEWYEFVPSAKSPCALKACFTVCVVF